MIPAGMEEQQWPQHSAAFPDGEWEDVDIEAFDEPQQ